MHNSKEILEISKALDNPTSIYMDPKQRTQIYVAFQQVAERFRRMECALDALKKTKQVTYREGKIVAWRCPVESLEWVLNEEGIKCLELTDKNFLNY